MAAASSNLAVRGTASLFQTASPLLLSDNIQQHHLLNVDSTLISHHTQSMALVKIDWEQFRTESSELPPDIFFKALHKSRIDANIELETDEDFHQATMIGAHKLLLAGASPVFRANFFGPVKMEGELMVVRETTVEAFATLINFIYWPPGEEVFSLKNITSFEELCDIVEISERYQILDLRKVAVEALETLEITSKNVISAATVADTFKAFEDVKNLLINKSLAFIDRTMNDVDDVFSFMLEAKQDNPENGLELFHGLLKEREKKRRCLHVTDEWRTIIFSRKDEQLIQNSFLTRIKGSYKHWKFGHEFKPTSYLEKTSFSFSFTIRKKGELRRTVLGIAFTESVMVIRSFPPWPAATFGSKKLPSLNQWTSIEITNKEVEPGRSLLTIMVGAKQVFQKEDVGSRDLSNMTIETIHYNGSNVQPGYIRRLSILTNKRTTDLIS